MKRFRNWLVNKFLPTWARESLLEENSRLEKENRELREQNRLLNAYLDGLESGLKAAKKITINNNTGEVRK